jgi:OOP family OmpA-OmpF porin
MNRILIWPLAILLAAGCLTLSAQEESRPVTHFWKDAMRKLKPSPWIIGLGWNIVDDDGNPFKKGLAFKSLNAVAFPSTLTVEKNLGEGWSLAFCMAYNYFKTGQYVNSTEPLRTSSKFWSYDLNGRYSLCNLYDINAKWFHAEQKIIDIYSVAGMGYTIRNSNKVKDVASINIGLGGTLWFYKSWGINLQGLAKFGLKEPFFRSPYNYLQYNLGLVYAFSLFGGNPNSLPIL